MSTIATELVEFPHIQAQGKVISLLYKAVGLYSIPLLTIVTILSLTNVFTAGTFIHISGIQLLWAIIFSAAIEVNSVRLFIESALDNDNAAFVIAIILSIVAGAALLIEGLQQSIGLDWNSEYLHWIIALLIMFRVFCVVILLGREGRKLGHSLKTIKPPVPETKKNVIEPPTKPETEDVTEHITEPLQSEIEASVMPEIEVTTEHEIEAVKRPVVRSRGNRKKIVRKRGNGLRLVQQELEKDPQANNATISKNTGLSPSHVSSIRKVLANSVQDTLLAV